MLVKIFSWILIFFAVLTSNMKTPLSLASILFTQCLVISILTRLLVQSSWVPLTLFMITVGGLLIIFMYTTSITSNMHFKSLKFMKPFLTSLFFTPIMYSLKLPWETNDNITGFDFMTSQYFKLFLPLNSFTSLFIFSYLIFVLIILISLMSISKGPMRKKY